MCDRLLFIMCQGGVREGVRSVFIDRGRKPELIICSTALRSNTRGTFAPTWAVHTITQT